MRGTVTSEGLNVHSRPAGPQIDAMKHGDRFTVLAGPVPTRTLNWYQIEAIVGEAKGWVDSRFIILDHEAKPIPRPKPPEPPHEPPKSFWSDVTVAAMAMIAGIVVIFLIIAAAFR